MTTELKPLDKHKICQTKGCNYPASGLWLITDNKDGRKSLLWMCAKCGMYEYARVHKCKVELLRSISTLYKSTESKGLPGDKPTVERKISPIRVHKNGMNDVEIWELAKKLMKKEDK